MKAQLFAACVVEWRSTRVKLAVKSTLALAAAALPAAEDRDEFNCVLLMSGKFDTQECQPWRLGLHRVPGMLAVDARSFSDPLQKQGSVPAEERVALDLIAVREGLSRETDSLHWGPTRRMLADAMTKSRLEARSKQVALL